MEACCVVLKDKMLNQNKNGFSVYQDDEFTFWKFLAVDSDEIDDFVETMKKSDFKSKPKNVKISGEVVIQFCPFCGEKIII